jgi:hypothetical protein
MLEMLAEFPAEELDELVEEISTEELTKVLKKGESENWRRTVLDEKNEEIVIRNKNASDNSVRFIAYRPTSGNPMIGVQQVNAQVSATQIWIYNLNPNGDHPEGWNEYSLPTYKLDDFFDERIQLPSSFNGEDALPYQDIELSPKKIEISLNKWSFLSVLGSDSIEPQGALDPARIKYTYILTFNEGNFEPSKVTEAGYQESLTFTSRIAEDSENGPGIHEFDCAHGVRVTSSSVLASQGGNSYKATNLIDRSETTAWSEGAEGSGVGEWVEFTIVENFLIGSSWGIVNGYMKDKTRWQENNRVKKLKVLVDDQLLGYVVLANSSSYQLFDIAPPWMKNAPEFKKGTRIRFVVEEVYNGSRFDDTLISYFVPIGNCG